MKLFKDSAKGKIRSVIDGLFEKASDNILKAVDAIEMQQSVAETEKKKLMKIADSEEAKSFKGAWLAFGRDEGRFRGIMMELEDAKEEEVADDAPEVPLETLAELPTLQGDRLKAIKSILACMGGVQALFGIVKVGQTREDMCKHAVKLFELLGVSAPPNLMMLLKQQSA